MRRHETDATLDFGQRLLALLETGSFTTSYKYATLLGLIDEVLAAVSQDGTAPTAVRGRAIGRRVLALYWPQARPFSAGGPLRQSNVPGDIVTKVASVRRQLRLPEHVSLEHARLRHSNEIGRLEHAVEQIVLRYPIPLLQRFGSNAATMTEDRFIYNCEWAQGSVPTDDTLSLAPGAGTALAALAGLLRPVIQREWLRFVARRNSHQLDEFRVEQFLFGADRTALATVREPLLQLQQGRCFYCQRGSGPWEVDHFLPWARWPDDGLDNLVVAHRACNNDKRAALAGLSHLSRWWPRLDSDDPAFDAVRAVADHIGWPRRPDATVGGARALYLHQPAGTMLWSRRGFVEPLDTRRLSAVLIGCSRAEIAADDDPLYRR